MSCCVRIYKGAITNLSLSVIGIRVTDCTVRDGLGWGEQRLINNNGCPVDNEIMGNLHYSKDKTRADVHFQAHKFPYTASVYYQCNVQLCHKDNDGCEHVTVRNKTRPHKSKQNT